MSTILQKPTLELLEQARIAGPFHVHALAGGGNNQVYQIQHAAGSVVLKSYFADAGDVRDRAASEYAFSSHAWECGSRRIAKPIACNAKDHIALFEFVDGTSCRGKEVTKEMLEQALCLIKECNPKNQDLYTQTLPDASESCFSIEEHLQRVDHRIDRLRTQTDQSSPIGLAAFNFVDQELSQGWHTISEKLKDSIATLGLSLTSQLATNKRIVSPSDFGFHNALRKSDDTLVFIDFEYAGWDDSAKLCGDFFSQQAVPVPLHFASEFISQVASLHYNDKSDHQQECARINALLPVYAVKWCCIILNEFTPIANKRRAFAKGEQSTDQKQLQLQRAKTKLDSALRSL